ncbi:MAG: zf-HC2 domain-containing protein [Acidobacteriia bacterium]|nr:zf-HC2 domain-containing protein [Terriglobia bacterium]
MNCQEYKERIMESVEGDHGAQQVLQAHFATCPSCRRDFEELSQVKKWMQNLPHHGAPRELGLAIRAEYSKRASFSFSDRFWMRIENLFRPMAVPALAGVLLAIVCFTVMFSTLWMTPALPNAPGDVQLSIHTAPRSRPNSLLPIATDGNSSLPDEPILVETSVDPHGRVYDFKILSGPDSPPVIESLERVLYFTVFDPATSFGRPTGGKAILSFRTVRVLG